jgi:hypothetical protein
LHGAGTEDGPHLADSGKEERKALGAAEAELSLVRGVERLHKEAYQPSGGVPCACPEPEAATRAAAKAKLAVLKQSLWSAQVRRARGACRTCRA